MGKVVEVNDSNFQEEVLESECPVIVDFWAPWCGYCTKLAPILDELAEELNGRVKFAKLNVDENRNMASQYAVMSLPTMILFKNGQPADKFMGYMPKTTLSGKILSAV
jgi:thioredoxin 1